MNQNRANPSSKPIRRLPPITQVSKPEGIQALIIDYYANKHHPLAGGIAFDELADLTASLQARLARVAPRLSISLTSMGRLDDALFTYARRARRRGEPFTDEAHLQMVREIAAYMGCVTLGYGQTTWMNPGSLLEVAVEGTGDLVVDDRHVGRVLMNVGCYAAMLWDVAVYGKGRHHHSIVWDTWDE